MQADGSYGAVQALVVETRPQLMYDLTVDTAHTFFVGDGEWLAHNICDLRQTAEDYARQRSLDAPSKRKRPFVVAVMETPDGKKYYGWNKHGENPDNVVLDVISQHTNDFKCAEVKCINDAVGANSPLQGAKIIAIEITGPIDDPHLRVKSPCAGGCDLMLDRLGIEVIE